MSNDWESNGDNIRIRIGSQVIFLRKLKKVKERKAKKWLLLMMIIKYNCEAQAKASDGHKKVSKA